MDFVKVIDTSINFCKDKINKAMEISDQIVGAKDIRNAMYIIILKKICFLTKKIKAPFYRNLYFISPSNILLRISFSSPLSL